MCGIMGVTNHPNATRLTYLGLYSLQHRGQESSGIVSTGGYEFYKHRRMGMVNDVFRKDKYFKRLKGNIAIGHNRYSTTGLSNSQNLQPFIAEIDGIGKIAIAHNGNITNYERLKTNLQYHGSIFQTNSDSEVILHLIANIVSSDDLIVPLEERIKEALVMIEGAYSLVFMTKTQLIVARDSYGYRPLCIGKLDNGFVVASETCALDIIGAKLIKHVEPNTVEIIKEK